jgi:CheY-like chemotaxis protein
MMDKKALVVDDNEVNRVLAQRLLSKAGWKVEQAEDGQAALDWLAANTVDLVLLDISMPNLCGQDVCRRIRADKLGGEDIRLVAYTAHAMNEQRDSYLTCGFDTVLIKPVSRQTMLDMLLELGLV